MEKVEKLEAELKLERLEQKFGEAKATDKVTSKMKTTLREARRDYRENFRSAPVGTVVSPSTVSSSSSVKRIG